MDSANTHAAAILSRSPAESSPPGAVISSRLVFTSDLLNSPALDDTVGRDLWTWTMAYFDQHAEEHTPAVVGALAAAIAKHPDWSTAEDASRLTVMAALS